jgi:hypothetical protein
MHMLGTLPSGVGRALGLVPRGSWVQTQPFPEAHCESSFPAFWHFEITYMHFLTDVASALMIHTIHTDMHCISTCMYLIHTITCILYPFASDTYIYISACIQLRECIFYNNIHTLYIPVHTDTSAYYTYRYRLLYMTRISAVFVYV